jgi:hypothetical protein
MGICSSEQEQTISDTSCNVKETNHIVSCFLFDNPDMDEIHNCFDITNLSSVIDQIKKIKKEDKLVMSTCTQYDNILVDESKRKSFTATQPINIIIKPLTYEKDHCTYHLDEVVTVNSNFEYIEYATGGFFAQHTDKEKPNANMTVLIYPPQTIEGGELCLNLGGYNGVMTFKPLSDKWLVVLFPNLMPHESKIITSGTKLVLKGSALLKKNGLYYSLDPNKKFLED